MSEEITLSQLLRWLQRYAEYIETNEAHLSELMQPSAMAIMEPT
ncbi:MAG: hypothetical protein R2932_32480 [Caldilineaceae bacterium]